MARYILTYDWVTVSAIQEQLAAFVKSNRYITQWVHPFIGCYLLKSDSDLVTISSSFGEFFAGQTLHLLSPISGSTANGFLPQYIWDWLNEPEATALEQLYLKGLAQAPRKGLLG